MRFSAFSIEFGLNLVYLIQLIKSTFDLNRKQMELAEQYCHLIRILHGRLNLDCTHKGLKTGLVPNGYRTP